MPKRLLLKTLLLGLTTSCLSISGLASAQNFPDRPITIVVPVPPGGLVDASARLLSEPLGRVTGQSIIIDNRQGASGNIAYQFVARSKPDGYTLLASYSGYHAANPLLMDKLTWDPFKDFTPIGMIGATPNVLIINSDLPIKNFAEFIDYAKKNPAKLSYGSAGPGTLTHLGMEQLKLAAGIFMVHVPYRGVGPAYTDLLAGQTQAMFPTLFAALPYLTTNRVRGLAVTGAKRSSAAPNIPTFKELGFNGFDGQQWYGVVGPANLSPAIVTKLNTELNKVLALPDFSEKMTSEAMTLMPMTPPQFGNYIKEDIARWAKVAKDRNIEIE